MCIDTKAISTALSTAIDMYCSNEYGADHRSHLGASLIGDSCRRKLWYVFRWVQKPKFNPRMLRLFQTGHLEEHRFVEYLKGIGCTVYNTEDDQARVSEVEGHFGGSLDGWGYLPHDFGIEDKVLFEFKTSNEKYFKELQKSGVERAKPMHYNQMCTYGYLMKIDYALYIAKCKDTDDLHVEFIKLNHHTGKMNIAKARSIITSQEPLPRLHENPAYWECKFCDFHAICHQKAPIEKNCRSCKNAVPVKGGEWVCKKIDQIIPKDAIGGTYDCWESIVE